MILTFYDLETSGLDTTSCDVLQIAYAQFDVERFRVVRSNSFYLWEDNYHYGDGAAAVHGIQKEFLQSLPKEEMLKKYQEIFAIFNRADVIGYNNIKYDDPLLSNFMRRHAQPIILDSQQDVMDMARKYLGGKPGKLVDLPAKLGIPQSLIYTWQKILFKNETKAHDATYDVASTFVCFDMINRRRASGI